ncbi:AAA family ATPase [Vibrio vulnificus]|uniref:AAA family ATPase n=1 Tax=Vibrio vulnificus TaxID=672 RepID=UPI001F50F27F|nr:AAA family ATPase [Vibrio vulnificus]
MCEEKTTMTVTIKNCNSVDEAEIDIAADKLNIKFAPNGTGKSTLAKAVTLHAKGEDLSELMPFKLRKNNPEGLVPTVESSAVLNHVMCFDEDYVRQFTFQEDELLSNSFDILIRTDGYIAVENEIQQVVQDINNLFDDNAELEALISTLKELAGAFKLTKDDGLSQTSVGMKGLSQGNKLVHIPEGLEVFEPFISSSSRVNWIDWQTKGFEQFSTLSDCCPFCSSDTVSKTEQIQKVSEEYDKNVIKNLVKMVEVFEKSKDYFTEDAQAQLTQITSLSGALEDLHVEFLKNAKKQIDFLTERLEKLRSLRGYDFKEGEDVKVVLEGFKIDLTFIALLNSTVTQAKVNSINDSIDTVVTKARLLQGKLRQQRSGMQRVITKHQKDINNFLAYAGYKYEVQIVGQDDASRLKLRHIDHEDFVSGGGQHLSFGERNAFAIVLFMYECLSKNPDLIILDDPISSFDKNKKFAILQMLFRRDAADCLKSKTVLMLTHDVEPIIDTLKAVSQQFSNQVLASYLRYETGVINELLIERDDIKTFSQICSDYLSTGADPILKLIYLRRHYEIVDDMGDAYQVLSNLLHLRPIDDAIDTREEGYPIMESSKLDNGVTDIAAKITGFGYDAILGQLQSKEFLKALYDSCSNGYEKLQVFRLFSDINVDNSVLQKFINETYHIENEYICQLDPTKYDLIPEYVVKACDACLAEAGL